MGTKRWRARNREDGYGDRKRGRESDREKSINIVPSTYFKVPLLPISPLYPYVSPTYSIPLPLFH
jgi:hypothetical protein